MSAELEQTRERLGEERARLVERREVLRRRLRNIYKTGERPGLQVLLGASSATGAALQDVIVTASNRLRAVGFVLIDVRVQGEGAAGQVAAAIRMADARRSELGIDAILVTRGGGSP